MGELLVFLNLLAILGSETVDDDGGDIEEKDASSEIGGAFGGELVFLERGDEECAVGERCDGGPDERGNGAEINGGGYDGEVINRIVVAVDADVAGVVEEKRGEENFDDDGVGGAPFWKPRDEAAFEELKNADGKEDDLFVDFVDGGVEGRERGGRGARGCRASRRWRVCDRAFRLGDSEVNLAWN